MTPAEAAARAAARYGVHLAGDAAEDVAAAVLDAHDDTVTADCPVRGSEWGALPEDVRERMRHALVRRLLEEVDRRGAIPAELPQLAVSPAPDFAGVGAVARMSMRVRRSHAEPAGDPRAPVPPEWGAMAGAATDAAARYGVHLAGDAAAAVAAAVLACHDGVAESSEIVWPEAWERDKEPRQRRMALTLLEEVIERGELPVERPRVHIREARDVPYGPTMEVRMSVRTRRPAGRCSHAAEALRAGLLAAAALLEDRKQHTHGTGGEPRPGPDCGKPDHPHCPVCPHCLLRHEKQQPG